MTSETHIPNFLSRSPKICSKANSIDTTKHSLQFLLLQLKSRNAIIPCSIAWNFLVIWSSSFHKNIKTWCSIILKGYSCTRIICEAFSLTLAWSYLKFAIVTSLSTPPSFTTNCFCFLLASLWLRQHFKCLWYYVVAPLLL